jgi:hypothetical protein
MDARAFRNATGDRSCSSQRFFIRLASDRTASAEVGRSQNRVVERLVRVPAKHGAEIAVITVSGLGVR